MAPWMLLLLFLALRFPAQASPEAGLRVWVRDLDDRGVPGVQFQIVDAAEQRRDVLTDAQGVALITPLPGAFVRIVGATGPDGQPVLMDENDPAGGLRIPLQVDVIQPLDLRVSDGLLFVEPVAEPATPPSPLPTTTGSADPATTAPLYADAAIPAPEDVAARSDYGWVRWLVAGVILIIVAVVIIFQAVAIRRARRTA